MKAKLVFFMALLTFTVSSCMTLSTEYIDANIRYVSYPGAVAGMTNVGGYTSEVGNIYSIDEIGRMAANAAAREGWTNITVLVKLIQKGSTGVLQAYDIGGYTTYLNSGGSMTVVEITYWR